MNSKTSVARHLALWILILAVVLGLWQALVSVAHVSRLIIAPPSEVLTAFEDNSTQFLQALGTTAIQVLIAACLAVVVGICFGAATAASTVLYEAFSPVFNASIAVPWIILYPLFLVWFGLGGASKVAFAFVLGVAPVAAATAASFRSIDAQYLRVARAFRATRWQAMQKILIPAALPGVVAGVRLGIALATIGVIVAQLLGSNSGLGYLISYYRTLLDTGQVYVGIILALALAFAVSILVKVIDRANPSEEISTSTPAKQTRAVI